MKSLFVVVLLVGAVTPVHSLTIRDSVTTLERGGTVVIGGDEICASRLLPVFYRHREFALAWTLAGQPLPRSHSLIAAIKASNTEGLDPDDYHLRQISELAERTDGREELDILLTDAFLLLGSHLLTGRVNPHTVTSTWCLEPRAGDVLIALEGAMESDNVASALDALRPRQPAYTNLRRALMSYRDIAAHGGWKGVGVGPPLRRGQAGDRVRRLALRLVATGDMPPTVTPFGFFDFDVEMAVRHFQRRHGLNDDGVVGRLTLRALEIPVEDRIDEIILNLERLRWLPDPGARFAVINIAAFELLVIENERVILKMRIVVGKSYQRTPVFSSEINEVIFSPYWNIPQSIARTEILQSARRDPSFLAREQIETLPNGRLRQRPGPRNALGKVKFMAPNDYGVYLHDTPARSLFERSARAFSHGCMRLEHPLDLAAYLLHEDPRWTRATIEAAADAEGERAVRLRSPLPLHVLYWTAWVDEGGVQFREDVYERNQVLRAAMRQSPRRI